MSYGNMLRSRRGDDLLPISLKRNTSAEDLTRSSDEIKRICSGGERTDQLVSGDFLPGSNQCVWNVFSNEVASNLSKSVVSLSFKNGNEVLFACSGIALERVKCATRFLTSASFARALIDKRKDYDNLKVEVRHGDGVFTGFLREYYDLDHSIAVVIVMSSLDVHVVPLGNPVKFLPSTKVLALGHNISGKLMVSSGQVIGDSNLSEYCVDLKLSTCKISKVFDGGALFDCDGKFLGMNFYETGRTFFLPTRAIFFQVAHCGTLRRTKFPVGSSFFNEIRIEEKLKYEVHSNQLDEHTLTCYSSSATEEIHLDSLGYPKPSLSMLNDGMILVNTFEEPFGDEFGEGVWSQLPETVPSNIQENTVAIASFNGERRFFACSGFFIKWNGCSTILTSASLVRKSGFQNENKIDENLRIEVLLPNKQRREGTLQHYNLHYNIALVGVKDFHASRPTKIQHFWDAHCRYVVAVGYCFETGKLMAAEGERFARPVTLKCQHIGYSTCKITKVGIGGPLLDFDGRFIAMNFYEKTVGTPYLKWTQILPVLEQFKTEGSITEGSNAGVPSRVIGDHYVGLNSWPVPRAYWCHPGDRGRARTGGDFLVYMNGQKIFHSSRLSGPCY